LHQILVVVFDRITDSSRLSRTNLQLQYWHSRCHLLADARINSDRIPQIDGGYMKKMSCLLTLSLVLAPLAQVAAQTQKNLERAKKNVAKLGGGPKAKAVITLNDGTKVKGYVYNASDDDFVIRNSKTDSPTTVSYADVKIVEDNRHNAKMRGLLIGIGAAAVGAYLFAVIATRGGVVPGNRNRE